MSRSMPKTSSLTPPSPGTATGAIAIGLWGSLALLTQLAGQQVPALQLQTMTFTIAFVLLGLHAWRRGQLSWRHVQQPALAWLLGIGGYFGFHICYFVAMRLAPAVDASLITYLWPLLIVVFSAALPDEHLRFAHIVGALIALGGCWLLISNGQWQFHRDYLLGYLLAFASAVIWATYSVGMRWMRQSHRGAENSAAVVWYCGATALLSLICHLTWEETLWPNQAQHWLGIVGLGLGPVGVAFLAWDHGIKHGNLPLLGVLAYAAPVISVALLVLFGFAEASPRLLFACAAIVCGALIASDYRQIRRHIRRR